VINAAYYFDRKLDYLPDLVHPNALGQINLFTALKKHINYKILISSFPVKALHLHPLPRWRNW
jgi:hypothetical protein